jgi:predicted Zn-dependent protease
MAPRIDANGCRFFLLLAVALTAAGCATTALTPAGKDPGKLALEEDEGRLWNRAREEQEQLRRARVEYIDPALKQYLDDVAHRVLSEEARQAGLTIDVRIIKNPALNAFMYPNGVMYIHTGLLARMDNEAQLATLVGHEMTHATHRHLARQFRDIQNKTAFMTTLSVAAMPFGVWGMLASVLGQLGAIASVYGYSQDLEREADQEGFQLMVRAGYDPREAPKLFMHLKQWVEEEKKPEPFFLNTHPRLVERIESYEEILRREGAALARGGPLRIGEEVFLVHTRRLILDNALLDLQGGRFLQARRGLQKFLALNPEDAPGHYFLAESYRRQNDPTLHPEAIRLYEGAIALDSEYADPYRGLGTLYYQAGQPGQAAQALERYLELTPAAPDRGYIQGMLDEVRK